MAYTLRYYPSVEATLDQAQFAKMELGAANSPEGRDLVVEAGLRLGRPGDAHGRSLRVKVARFSNIFQRNKVEFARRRARERGLDHLVEFVEDDYRNIQGTFDVFVSVGMLRATSD